MVAPIAFPFRPDWTDGISERLSWLTAIQTSRSGAEQRQALRVSPRRQLDIPLILTDQERSYFEVVMARNGGSPWYVPLVHEEIPVGYTPPGATTFDFDTSYREISVGTKMLLRGTDGLHSEIVEVTSIASDHIVTTPVVTGYMFGSITPTFLGVISEKTDIARRTGRVYTGTVRFASTQAMTWPVASRALVGFSTAYQGYPVLTDAPNAANDLTHTFERMWSTVDNSQSIPTYTDKAARQFTSQQYQWFLYGRQEHQDFRDRLFYLQGKCNPIWMPTFNDDIAPSTGYPNPLGFESTPPPGRQNIIRFNRNGTVLCSAAAAYATGDRIPIAPFDSETILRISFMALNRLDVDDIEVLHHSTTDGVATVSAIFRDAPDLRVPSTYNGIGYGSQGYVQTGGTVPVTNGVTIWSTPITITGPAGGAT